MDNKTLLIKDNDLVLDNHSLVLIEGPEEEAQSLERALTTDINEWFLHDNHGLDYSYIYAKPFDEERARLAVIETIHQDPRIESVEKVEFEFINNVDEERLLIITFEAKMKGRKDPIRSEISASGYVIPIVDFRENLQQYDEYGHVQAQQAVQIDLGFIVDEPEQRIDYVALKEA